MTVRFEFRRACGMFAALFCVAGLCGCSPPPASTADTERFVPSGAQAEAALRAVFEAWKQGMPAGMVPDTSPAVHVTDTYRRPGETLVDYRILGEVPSDKKRCYAVELRYTPERAERTRFLVVGIDPLWVFRLEDAENLAHWEHKMETPKAAAEAAAAGSAADDDPVAELPPPPPQAEARP